MFDEEFRVELWHCLRSIRSYAENIFNIMSQGSGLTVLQAFALAHIKMKGISNVGELAKELDINQSNASTMCKKLEHEGFIKRIRSGDDERVVVLEIAEKGREAISLMEEHYKKLEPIISQIQEDKLNSILTGLKATEEIFVIVAGEIEKQNI